MKKFTLSLFIFLFISTIAFADVNALFVNDNSANESNTEMVFEVIEQYLGELTYFNAVASARSPVFFEMAEFNLVIWYCGLDEDDLYIWNDNYQDNPSNNPYNPRLYIALSLPPGFILCLSSCQFSGNCFKLLVLPFQFQII